MIKNKTLEIVGLAFITACSMFGGFLGLYIYGIDPGDYAMAIIGGPVIGIVVFLLISKWNKKRNGKVPSIDERTLILMQRYLMAVLYVVLLGSAAALLILYAMGIHSIEIGMLVIYMMGLFILIGLGAIVTKHL